MKNLAEELEKLLGRITQTELQKNFEVRKKCKEIKELLNSIKKSELSNGSPMLKFINAKVLLEN
jgi:hypothetical protein